MPPNIKNSKLNGQIPLDKLKLNQKSYLYLQNSAFSLASQPQNPEFRNNPEIFHPCKQKQIRTIIVIYNNCIYSCELKCL